MTLSKQKKSQKTPLAQKAKIATGTKRLTIHPGRFEHGDAGFEKFAVPTPNAQVSSYSFLRAVPYPNRLQPQDRVQQNLLHSPSTVTNKAGSPHWSWPYGK